MIEKPISDFNKKRDGYQPMCKECYKTYNKARYEAQSEKLIAQTKAKYKRDPEAYKARSKQWVIDNPEKTKERHLKRTYGITLQEYNDLLQKQQDLCSTCKTHKSAFDYDLHVDHNHITGKVRGLLCGDCNRAIGMLKDSTTIVSNVLDYLKSFEEIDGTSRLESSQSGNDSG